MAEWQGLFTGTDLAGWSGSGAVDHDWEVVGGVALDADDSTRLSIEAGKGVFHNGRAGRTADLVSTVSHGDCELHLEFMIPEKSNSGVYVMGLYEIQILDSWGETELKYSTCGGVYCQWIDEKPVGGTPPILNASRPPGEWQSYDITFRAPRFDDTGKKLANACFECLVWNDQVVHENVEVHGPTRASLPKAEGSAGNLMLQGDHGPVAFRNVRIREL